MRMPFGRTRSTRLLQISAVLTLVALALMAWALIDPTVLPVMLSMTAGQALGTTALALYIFVIVRDLRRDRSARAARTSLSPLDSLAGIPRVVPPPADGDGA